MRPIGLLDANGHDLALRLCPNGRLDTRTPEIQEFSRCVHVSERAGERAFMLDLDTIFDPDRLPHAAGREPCSLTADDLPADWHYAWDERAAIMQYDGGLPREHAEAEALKYVLEDMRQAGGFEEIILALSRSRD
jgi:hypothetical protein